jgi:RecJ-like exonuclease
VKTCPDCNGDGVIEKGTDDEQQCPTCGGSGFVPDDDNDEEEVTRTNRHSASPKSGFKSDVAAGQFKAISRLLLSIQTEQVPQRPDKCPARPNRLREPRL